ncbi:MAG: HU family DNA-binding protein [Odoribacteraceae bacterium]|jgi:predicted histone-like DNA-binding protein|nr:HU family DNA-binding protein [Odoribacteraceae bacterium]
MTVPFVTVEKGNPADPSAPKKHYASAKARGELRFRGLGKEIAEGSTTVSDTDVLAVLNDLVKILCRHLANGEIVRFGDFGSFQIGLRSEGAETAEKFRPSMIKSTKVVFRPGIDLKEMQKTLKFEKV